MSRLSEQSRLVLALAVLAVAQAAAIATLVLRSAPPRPLRAAQAPVAMTARQPATNPALDALRNAASMGDGFAERQLVGELLDRYERSHDSDELLEAVQWMDHGWDTGEYQRSGVATQVYERYCDHRVLKWHWLCIAGE
jgi:hypothetical protein